MILISLRDFIIKSGLPTNMKAMVVYPDGKIINTTVEKLCVGGGLNIEVKEYFVSKNLLNKDYLVVYLQNRS